MLFDAQGYPHILYITSRHWQPGPKGDPRTWKIASWTGSSWVRHTITDADSNYDMGSLFASTKDGRDILRLVAPTETGPQRGNPGGEVAMWESTDNGVNWQKLRDMTENSPYNHTYVRRPRNAHPDFYAVWADGHGREPSPVRLYFSNEVGEVFQLPTKMTEDRATPQRVPEVLPQPVPNDTP